MATASPAAQVCALLQNTLSPVRATRTAAEASLEAMKGHPGFAMTLMGIVHNQARAYNLGLQQAAALYFKNLVKEGWQRDEGSKFQEDERTQIKTLIVDLMCAVPPSTQRQLSEALTIISNIDFPDKWDTLLDNLIARLATTDFNVINGLLETANSICKRFRNVYDTDAVRRPLRYVLDKLAMPLLGIFQTLLKLVDANAANKDALEQVLKGVRIVCRIFYSLNWMTIPEEFQDNLPAWMPGFKKILTYSNKLLEDPDEEMQAGPVESAQAAIVENVNLYADKYEEEFAPYFPQFVADIWSLLTRVAATPRFDSLVVTSLRFLNSVMSKSMHQAVFQDASRLEQIVANVVLPNITMTENDEDLFEENPTEYIRRDIEGADTDTRRRVAAGLLQTLVKVFPKPITALCTATCDKLLKEYATNPAQNWKQKDTAISIFIASAVKAQTRARGVSEINPDSNVGVFFATHIQPELQEANINNVPVVKASCIKFVCTFRNQLPKAGLVALLPIVANFLRSTVFVVHTYAASTIERMLTVRERLGADKGVPLAVQAKDLQPMISPLLDCVFGLLLKEGYPENEYIVRCLCRIVYSAKASILPAVGVVLANVGKVLAKITKDPRQPTYNHYVFECLAALVRNVCGVNPASVTQFEAALFPSFNIILAEDVMEFLPYVFQIMAQLLRLRPAATGAAARANLSDAYKALLAPLLRAELWARKGNSPALVMLMKAYIAQAPDHLVTANCTVPILGVFQKLLSLRSTELQAFDLLNSLIANLTTAQLTPYLGELFKVIIKRQQSNNTVKFMREFVETTCLVAAVHGGPTVQAALGKVIPSQPQLFYTVVDQVFVPNAQKVLGRVSRKTVVVGFARMLGEIADFLTPPRKAIWLKLLTATLSVCELPEDSSVSKEEEAAEFALEEQTASEYTGTYTQLAYCHTPRVDPLAKLVPKARVFLAQQIHAASTRAAGQVPALLASADPRVAGAVTKYLTAAQLPALA